MHDPIANHWDKRTRDFLLPFLAATRHWIRIATGFFTVQGYALLSPHFADKHVQIMVGYDETSHERLREMLVEDILVHLSRWDITNRRQAVIDLVDKLQRGQFQLVELSSNSLEARVRRQDHGKLFLFDEECAVVGSANLTVNGLLHNAEGMYRVDAPEAVRFYLDKYELYWNHPDTYDLTAELLAALLRWLDLHQPYDVYLKTLLTLVPKDPTEAPRPSYKMPSQYQQVVVERMLRQLKEYRGSMLVASTGLGKTVMATHTAFRLRRLGLVDNVIVFAPSALQRTWERELSSAGLTPKFFTRDLLDRPRRGGKGGKLGRMLEALQEVDEKHLIILDESQYFKNKLRARDSEIRHSIQRLSEIIEARQPYVVLLTATPLAKGVTDLNHQLYLLPHTAPRNYVDSKGQEMIPNILDDLVAPQAWKVFESGDYVEQFMNLPVCTVISTSQVAKNFAVPTPDGDYVEFPNDRRWIPQIEITKVKVPVPVEKEMSEALRRGLFKHELRHYRSRGKWSRSETTVQQHAALAWLSSPLALKEVLEKTIQDQYKVTFVHPEEARYRVLNPILEELRSMSYWQDKKFESLCELLRRFEEQGRKVVVFVERHATAVYLERSLKAALPSLRVATTSTQTETGYDLKDFEKEVYDLIRAFAPKANAEQIGPTESLPTYDVLIMTDAYSTGVNLEDASVVISYDLAWTGDVIIQRAGRILRLWRQPRRVHLIVFVGNFQADLEKQNQTWEVEHRLNLLTERSQQAQKFSEIPVFPEGDSASYRSLAGLSSVTIEELGLADLRKLEEFGGESRFISHITQLQQNREHAEGIPDDIMSALAYRGRKHQLYLLLRQDDTYHWTLYDVAAKELSKIREDDLLDLIHCQADTPVAGVSVDRIEEVAQECKIRWCQQNWIDDPEGVERICALYLVPKMDEGPQYLLT